MTIIYEQVLEDAKGNDEIVGFILVGSRGKGFENEHSDYDVVIVVRDDAEATRKNYDEKEFDNLDLKILSLSDFKKFADWESPEAWDRYSFAHVKILVDKTSGELENIIKAKGEIPADKLDAFIDQWIDGYVNGVFRSIKCIRNKNAIGAHLEAVNSMLDLLTLVFALNGRHRPFLSYTKKELEKYPLQHLPWTASEFVEKIKTVLETADLQTQQELLKGVEKMSREMGHGHMFDGWEGKDKWAMNFKEN